MRDPVVAERGGGCAWEKGRWGFGRMADLGRVVSIRTTLRNIDARRHTCSWDEIYRACTENPQDWIEMIDKIEQE